MVTLPENFEELEIYRTARELRRRVFQLSHFLPDKEPFRLADQMRQLALDITNNIAQGHSCQDPEENIKLCQKAQSSLLVLQDDLNLCLDEGYYVEESLSALKKTAKSLQKQLEKNVKNLRKTCRDLPALGPPR